tara:strand:- start:11489 stop:12451 length:963 start_codon:yes stop_codon:yes gene_type:complete
MFAVMQAIINTFGFSLNYISIFTFAILVIPALSKFNAKAFLILLFVFCLQAVKSGVIGVGPEFVKTFYLLFLAAILILMSQKMYVEDFIDVIRRLRWLILLLGIAYLYLWIGFGTYRNANTFSLAIMLFFGFQGQMRSIALLFAATTKTTYKILFFSLFVSFFVRSIQLRTLFIAVSAGIGAVLPLILAKLITPETHIFSLSHTYSLAERVLETKALLLNMENNFLALVWGDRLGWVLESNLIDERGYVHSTHLWLLRTFGLPIWFVGFYFLVKTARFGSHGVFGIRAVILMSFAFFMTLFTSPFLTMFLLCRVRSGMSH